MSSFYIFLTTALFGGLALANPRSAGSLLQRRANIITTTVTKTDTTTLTTCPASTARPSTTSTTISTQAPVAAPNDTPFQQGCFWNVPGAGLFKKKSVYTFTGTSLPAGLMASDYPVDDLNGGQPDPDAGPQFPHTFQLSNVQVSGGHLNLVIPGGQAVSPTDPLTCAEIQTTESKIIMASVRTMMMFSNVPGSCHGVFFYKSDKQEIDIEYLTDPASLSNDGPNNPIPIWYSNQDVKGLGNPTHNSTLAPANDLTTTVHEYRIDWTPKFTAFYFDGQLQSKFTSNVPSQAGPWIWNNWANGDRGWSVGPPQQDNILKIQSIEMYYNTSSTTNSCSSK